MTRCGLLAFILLCVGCSGAALACRGPQFELALLFNAVPEGIEADVIVEVTFTAMVPNTGLGLPGEVRESYYQTAMARIERVIKGRLEATVIRVANIPTSCGPQLNGSMIGRRGYIAGKLVRDSAGLPLLFAKGQSEWSQRQKSSVR
jgi:hypothetical protein